MTTLTLNNLEDRAIELREKKALYKDLKQEIDGISDEIKAGLQALNIDTYKGLIYTITLKAVESSRFDSAAFKHDHPELYAAYCKKSTTERLDVK